jgi:hypothetical protein
MIWRVGLAILVAVGTVAYVAAGRPDSTAVLILTAHSIFSVVALVTNLYQRRRLRGMVAQVRAVEPVVATGLIEAPETNTGKLISDVRRLGFTETFATDTALGDSDIRTWVLLEPAGETWVEIGMGLTPMAIFLSEVEDGRLIETAYPHGESIDDPRLLAQIVKSDVGAALEAQRTAVRSAGGSRREVRTIDDYLAAEREQRERTGGMRIQAHLESAIGPSIRDYAISAAIDAAAFAYLFLTRPAP